MKRKIFSLILALLSLVLLSTMPCYAAWILFTEHVITHNFWGACSVYATDVDGDSDIDVLGAAYGDGIAWWENDGSENFTEHVIDDSYAGARWSVYATDVDGDSDIDVLGAACDIPDINYIAWWENDGSENFTKHVIEDNFWGAYSVYATDVDGDSDIDVLGAAYGDGIVWWENDGSQNFAKHVIDDSYAGASSVYATDVDGDSDIDVLDAADDDGIAWWKNDGSQNFTKHVIDDNFGGANSVYATDVDGDSDTDVLGAAEHHGIAWWKNDGSENFTKHVIDDNFALASSVYATDVDGDSDIDVLGTAEDDGIAWWENDGSENFTKHVIDDYFGGALSVYATDVDGDSDIDVLGASEYYDEITWWENVGADTIPPSNPTNVHSTSHTVGTWSNDNTVEVGWIAATDAGSGLDGYSILWDTNATTIPDAVKDIEQGRQAATSPALADGSSHYFHIRSVDNAGNWQSTVHLGPFFIDTTPSARPARPARFLATYPQIVPTRVLPNQPVNILLNVKNVAASGGYYNAVLYVDGEAEYTQTAYISPGQTQRLVFTVYRETPGKYWAAVDGYGAWFTVAEAAGAPEYEVVTSPPPPSGGLGTPAILAIILGSVGVGVAIFFATRPRRT